MGGLVRKRRLRVGLILLVLIAFGLSLRSEFVFDDRFIVEKNLDLREPAGFVKVVSTQTWSSAGIEAYTYRPLPMLTFWANYRLFGLQPLSYHLFNLIVHSAAVLLLFGLALRLGLSRAAATLAAALFAVHPLQTEPVAAVVGRMDTMAGAFFLAALLLHVAARQRLAAGETGTVQWMGAVLAYTAAVFSKEHTILLPAAAGLYDLLLARPAWRQGYRIYAGYAAAATLYLMVRFSVFDGAWLAGAIPFLDNPLAHVAWPLRVVSALKVAGLYLARVIVPRGISPDYCYAQILPFESLLDGRALLTLGSSSVLTVLAVVVARRSRAAAMAIAISVLTFLPVSNLLFPIGTVMGNRLFYLPLAGIGLLIGAGLDRVPTRLRRAAIGLGAVTVVVLAALTLQLVGHWRSDFTLDLLATRAAPECSRGHGNLGYDYLAIGRLEEAERAFRRSLEIYPAFDPALAGLASIAFDRGDYRRALDLAEEALALNPEVPRVLGLAADACMRLGEPIEAQRFWERRLRLEPDHSETMSNLAVLAWQRNEPAEAIALWTRASRRPDAAPEIWFNLARAHDAVGSVREAIAAYRRFLESDSARDDLRAVAADRIDRLRSGTLP